MPVAPHYWKLDDGTAPMLDDGALAHTPKLLEETAKRFGRDSAQLKIFGALLNTALHWRQVAREGASTAGAAINGDTVRAHLIEGAARKFVAVFAEEVLEAPEGTSTKGFFESGAAERVSQGIMALMEALEG